ncbi:phage major capsid protein [Blautia sp. HCP3S3_G8]|uniref:phage major capsid protein n=1 Tax=Blautia sp. HCP3S3_G8 TaxID=3438745 RepID=UPI003F9325F5
MRKSHKRKITNKKAFRVAARRYLQIRAEELKSLEEKRTALVEEMEGILNKAQEEQRAFEETEQTRFDEIEKEINAIDKTIEAKERARNLGNPKKEGKEKGDTLTVEERAFVDYIRGTITNERATNLTYTDNGAVIPSSIVNKIIEKVVEICPIYSMADRYNIGGTISIPFYDEDTSSIKMAYADEFTELTSTSGTFKSISLSGFLAGALTVISKKLINNGGFDVLNKIIQYMAKAISVFIEHECLIGTSGKAEGLTKVTRGTTAAAAAKVTADELIDVQESIPDTYQSGAVWIMNKATRTAIRKLKDNDGNYLLNRDVSARWGYTLLGKDVYCSDAMPKMEAEAVTVYYGDFSGLAVKVAEDANIEVLREKYATQHAVGVVAWMEIDTKVEDAQKIAKLTMASA